MLAIIVEKKVNLAAAKKAKPTPTDEVARKEEKKVEKEEEDKEAPEEKESEEGLLAGLLGGYDSENEEQRNGGDEDVDKFSNSNAPSAAQKNTSENPPKPLPSAADLLQ